MNKSTKVVILAAGKGARIGSALPKVLLPVGKVPMVLRLLDSVRNSEVDTKPIMVIGHGCEAVRDMVGSDAIFVLQEKQLGTGHALSTAREAVSGASNIVVLYGDHPFVSSNAISDVVSLREQTGAPIAMMTTIVPDWNDWRFVFRCWGRILRDQNNKIADIREWKDANDKEKEIKELNPGLYCFESGWLWKNIDGLECNNAQNEYYITDLVSMAVGQGSRECCVPHDRPQRPAHLRRRVRCPFPGPKAHAPRGGIEAVTGHHPEVACLFPVESRSAAPANCRSLFRAPDIADGRPQA